MENALILFVRKPELGKVKTRLAAKTGDEKALEIYIKLLAHTRTIASGVNCDKFVFVTDDPEEHQWAGFNMETQVAGDLGKKMIHAFNHLFQKGYRKVVIIGSDCPEISTAHIEDSFLSLDTSDLVIGPANDGGYYLLGMKIMQQDLFINIPWSTSDVFMKTINIINGLQLSYTQLEFLSDVDEESDLPVGWH